MFFLYMNATCSPVRRKWLFLLCYSVINISYYHVLIYIVMALAQVLRYGAMSMIFDAVDMSLYILVLTSISP